MLSYFLIGCALGAATGVPIGAVGLAVVDSACRFPLRRAIGIGLGGGLGDLGFSALGILGIGPLFAASPIIPATLYLLSGVALIAVGAWYLLRKPAPAAPLVQSSQPTVEVARPGARLGGGVVIGFGMVAANPASLVTWTVIVAGFMEGSSRANGLAAAFGIGVGSVAWFVSLAWLARRGAALRAARMQGLVRCAGALITGYGVYSLARGVRGWL